MNKCVAIQMDPIDSIDLSMDSSFMLGLEAQARGYHLLHYHPNDLYYADGRVMAEARPMILRDNTQDWFSLSAPALTDLGRDTDVVLMRQDPPFDMAYITATHLLEQVQGETLVVNDPAHVRNAPEKLFVTRFADLMPPTLITRSAARIREFRAKYKDIIVKPLFGNGGAGVFRLTEDDQNLNSLLELFFGQSREMLIIQQYIPEVRLGDKRIILVDGKPIGAVNRVPPEGQARSNICTGGEARATRITAHEKQICDRVGPLLKERGLIFVGIDLIGDCLTEINVTSPTCIKQINHFDGVKIEALIWDAIEERLG